MNVLMDGESEKGLKKRKVVLTNAALALPTNAPDELYLEEKSRMRSCFEPSFLQSSSFIPLYIATALLGRGHDAERVFVGRKGGWVPPSTLNSNCLINP